MGINVPEHIFSDLRARLEETLARRHAVDGGVSRARLTQNAAELACHETGPVKVLHIIEDEDADAPTVRLEDLIINETYRGSGHGTAILRTLIDACALHGVDLNLSANPMADHGTPERAQQEEQLLAWYEKLGFGDETRGRRDGNMIIRNRPPALQDPDSGPG